MSSDKTIIDMFRDLIFENLGIHISKEKDYVLENKLNKMLARSGCENLEEFYHSVRSGKRESIEIFVNNITTNHTFFFREREHLEILVNLINLKKADFITIWSAACSTGEEVYSIIIYLLEAGIKNFLLIASDINGQVLHYLNKGTYHPDRLQYIDSFYKLKYFKQTENGYYAINNELRKFIVIKKLNLIDEVFFEKKIDYIFCRNVTIYFNTDTRKIVLENLINNLRDDGYLFIGHSETLFNISNKMESVFNSVYSKKK